MKLKNKIVVHSWLPYQKPLPLDWDKCADWFKHYKIKYYPRKVNSNANRS